MIARGFKPISRAFTVLTVPTVSQGSCFRHLSDRAKQTATGQAERPTGPRKRLLAAQADRPGLLQPAGAIGVTTSLAGC